MSEVTPEVSNQVFLDHILSDDSSMQKVAADAVNDFTRVKMREEGFARRILPPIVIDDKDLDRQYDTDKPVKVVDKEPGNPEAITVPFGTTPIGRYIRAPRYRVMFARVQSHKWSKDIDELRTYHMDIRQIISDNSIKDMLAEEDGKWIAACNAAVGAEGSAQHTVITGSGDAITRSTLAESLKAMPRLDGHLQPAVALVNNITVLDVLKWTRDEAGGDLAQNLVLNGFVETKIMGVRWVVTIKTDLVPDNYIYYFAEPKFLGKFYTISDITMHLKREAYMIEFFAYETIGAAIGNAQAVTKHKFTAA